MSKNRTYELLDLAITCLSEDMNRLRGTQIRRNLANEALTELTQIQLDLEEIYPSSFEKVKYVSLGNLESCLKSPKRQVKI